MMKKSSDHWSYYSALLLILGMGFLGAYLSSPQRTLQMAIVVVTTVFYVSFGILHHALNHDLHTKIVIEYVLIGSLGLALMLFFMKVGLGV